jgi:hypothetical protein
MTQQEITAACRGARPNHVGGVIARHKRAGRIELHDGKLYATQSAKTGQTRRGLILKRIKNSAARLRREPTITT